MAKWIPGTAVLGLLCVMILPTPGILGILIGGICSLAIIGSLALLVLDRLATRVAIRFERFWAKRTRRARAIHAGSGIARKV